MKKKQRKEVRKERKKEVKVAKDKKINKDRIRIQ